MACQTTVVHRRPVRRCLCTRGCRYRRQIKDTTLTYVRLTFATPVDAGKRPVRAFHLAVLLTSFWSNAVAANQKTECGVSCCPHLVCTCYIYSAYAIPCHLEFPSVARSWAAIYMCVRQDTTVVPYSEVIPVLDLPEFDIPSRCLNHVVAQHLLVGESSQTVYLVHYTFQHANQDYHKQSSSKHKMTAFALNTRLNQLNRH